MSKVARGTSKTFEATFVDLDDNPLVRADGTSTPQVQIKDPEGTVITLGLGKPVSASTYVFEWHCPEDITLNTPENKYSAEWYFIVLGGSTRSITEEFDIIDRVEATPEERKQMYISLPDVPERVFFRTEQDPYLSGGSLELIVRGNSNNLIRRVVSVSQDPTKLNPLDPNRAIGVTEVDGEYVYYYDLDPLKVGEYLIFWGLRKTSVSSMDYEQQVLRVPHWNFWRFNKPLLTIIDKLQKRIGYVQSYSDADILEYLLRGLGTVNMVLPNTNWDFATIPTVTNAASGIANAVLLAATMHALDAQQIQEIELSFDHSGQTVTLGYNHDYSGVLGNIQTQFDQFVAAKPRLYRVACGPGVVGVRALKYRQGSRVFKLNDPMSDSPLDAVGFIANIFNA